MSYIRFENVSKSFAGKALFDGVSFQIEAGHRTGLVGRNGSGKSTILRLIVGTVEPDGGIIERMRKLRIGYLDQLPVLDPALTLMDAVLGAHRELIEMETRLETLAHRLAEQDPAGLDAYARLQEEFRVRGGYEFRARARQILGGLGFGESDFELPVTALSGGQRTRLRLALVLTQPADLLLLDEPENHLDLEAREWLEDFLTQWPGAFVLISHDRHMLNAVTNRTLEIDRGKLRGFTGNYESFVRHQAMLRERRHQEYERQRSAIEKEQRWIERFRYKATKARQVQSRIKRLEKLERIEAPDSAGRSARFHMGEVVRSGAVVLEAIDLAMAYGELRLYEGLSFAVERGERIGIIGPNGSGKTTLLRHLAGRLDGAPGAVRRGHKTEIGFYDQHHEDLNRGSDVFSEVRQVKPAWNPEQVRTYLGKFLFTGEDVFKPISALSGGELSRVALARLILAAPNVLLLDEPTNHLDIASREALEAALSTFPGSIVVVSHDRELIDRLVTRLIVLGHGRAEVHLGNYTNYRWRRGEAAASGPATQAKTMDEVLKIRRDKKSRTQKSDGRERRKHRTALEELERDIAQIEEMVAELETRFSTLDPADFETSARLASEYEGLKQDLSEMYAEWERLADEVNR
jgi:ATP-binding cassette subfamily F protein 3